MGFTRFTLASMVVIFHSGFGGGGGVYALYGFYLLSGYIVQKILLEKYNYNRGVYLFFLNRFLRLIPSFLIASFLMYVSFLGICNLFGLAECQSLPTNVTLYVKQTSFTYDDFINGVIPNNVFKINPIQYVSFFGFISAFWSISIELFYYIAAPLIMLVKFKHRQKVLKITYIIFFFIYLYYSFILTGYNDAGRWSDIVYRNSIPTIFFFLSGAMLYENINKFKALQQIQFFKNQNYPKIFFLIIALVVMIGSKYIAPPNYLIIQYNIWILLISLGVAIVIISEQPTNYFSKENRFDYFLGELSYPIYINHKAILVMMIAYEILIDKDVSQTKSILQYLLIYLGSLVIATIFYFVVDRNITKLRKLLRN